MTNLHPTSLLTRLQGGLVVSCQPLDDGPMDSPAIIVAMARAAYRFPAFISTRLWAKAPPTSAARRERWLLESA